MNNLFKTSILLFATSLVFSCQKRENETQTDYLTINLNQPTKAASYKKGDTVFIKATASYINEMHGYSFTISKANNNQIYFEIEEHVHNSSFSIDTFWIDNVDVAANLTCKLTAIIDHDGTEKTETVQIASHL